MAPNETFEKIVLYNNYLKKWNDYNNCLYNLDKHLNMLSALKYICIQWVLFLTILSNIEKFITIFFRIYNPEELKGKHGTGMRIRKNGTRRLTQQRNISHIWFYINTIFLPHVLSTHAHTHAKTYIHTYTSFILLQTCWV